MLEILQANSWIIALVAFLALVMLWLIFYPAH